MDSFGPKHCGLKFERGTFAMPRVLGIKNKMDAPFFGWVQKISTCCSDGIVQKNTTVLFYCCFVTKSDLLKNNLFCKKEYSTFIVFMSAKELHSYRTDVQVTI
jgi:hypothetical protein